MTAPLGIDRFLAEILEQPAVMRAAARAVGEQHPGLERLHRLGGPGASFVLTGMGSSFDACLAAASVLARQGVLVITVNAAELLHFRSGALTAETPVLAISQSGNSAELVRLAERLAQAPARPPLVSLTNGLDNPLARVADIAFDTAAGTEESPSTKTFAACLVLLRALADAIAGGEAFDAARTCRAAAADAERAAASAARLLADPSGLAGRMSVWCGERSSIVLLGRGTARAAAEMGALMLKEAARRQAESLDTAEFRHGPLELSGPELAVAIISTETATRELDRRLAAELERDGASVMIIQCEDGDAAAGAAGAGGAAAGGSIGVDELHPLLAPAVAVIPLQLLAWRLAVEGGRDPGRLTRASKVTTTECGGSRPDNEDVGQATERRRVSGGGERPAPPQTGALSTGRHYLRDGDRSVVPVGVHFVPASGPDWPWREGVDAFGRAFAAMAAMGLDSVRIDVLWSAVEPEPGRYDEAHLEQLDAILVVAKRCGLRLHPVLFIGGEVGDAVWDPAWRGDRHPHADPGLRRLQAEHAAMLARRWRDDPAVLAWDLTDEPPSWLCKNTGDDAAREWTAAIAGAIRRAGAVQPVTIGTASQEVDHGPFRADVVAGELDFACVHPYPIYSPELYPDSLLAARMTRAGAFETALATGAGRPVMVHEYGASSTQFAPERIATYDRLLAWSSFGRGAIGFFPWCWTDAEPAAYDRAPYVRMPHETQFGVTDHNGAARPRALALADLAATLRHLDLDVYASEGPVTDAALLVPHEYVRPYDPVSYGLGGQPAGPYVPAEPVWNPQRDVKPLIRGWLNAFVLAARAGLATGFPRESLDGQWPPSPLLLLPAPLTTTTCSLWHVRTSFWQRGGPFFDGGGTLYLSCCADTAIPEMQALAGCRIVDRAAVYDRTVLRFVEAWGGLAPGEELSLPSAGGRACAPGFDDLLVRGVRLDCDDARVIAVQEDGEPALVLADRGAGHVVTCAYPVELLLAGEPDAHGPHDGSWRLYAGLADLAGARDGACASHPDLTNGVLRGPGGGTIVVTNHADAPVHAPLRLPAGARHATLVGPRGLTSFGGAELDLEAYGAAILTWES